jgi:hypothetical protein
MHSACIELSLLHRISCEWPLYLILKLLSMHYFVINFDCSVRGIHNFRDWCCHLCSSCSSTMLWWIIVLAYLGSQCTKFHAAGWNSWFLTSFYMDVISQWIQQRNSVKCCADLGRSATETLLMIRRAFGEERMRRTQVLGQTDKDKTGEEQSQERPYRFL